MDDRTNVFKTPPVIRNSGGKERTVGYEFEFTGIEIPQAAHIVKQLYGGDIRKLSTYEYEVQNTLYGTFTLELDAQLLREKKYEVLLKKVGIDLETFKEKDSIEDSLMELVSSVVPFEIVTPPVPLSKMTELNNLVGKLREKKGKGTGSSMLYAFGLHINPEVSDESTMSILDHLRAYVLLDAWIRKDARIDVSRRITPFINPYKEEYLKHILEPGYSPGVETLIKDYFRFENSRNRALDLLPLFMYVNKEITSNFLKETLTSARPTYHYRLPNCSIENEKWSLADEWNRWVLVELLANDSTSLNQYSRAWLKMRGKTLIGFEAKWIELMDRWVSTHE